MVALKLFSGLERRGNKQSPGHYYGIFSRTLNFGADRYGGEGGGRDRHRRAIPVWGKGGTTAFLPKYPSENKAGYDPHS